MAEEGNRAGGFTRDAAFHPGGEVLAIVGEGRPVEVYRISDGALVKTIGDVSRPITIDLNFGYWRKSESQFVTAKYPKVIPPEHRGFSNVAFSSDGRRVIAGSLAEYRTEVYDFDLGVLIGSFSGCDTCIAAHPEGEIFATVRNDQCGASIRFVRVTDTFQCYLLELSPPQVNVSGLAFSPIGDALAVIGGAPPNVADWPIIVSVYDFPSCRMRFRIEIELPSELPPWVYVPSTTPIERVAFSPDGLRLIVPTPTGYLSELSTQTGEEVRRWKVHDGLVSTVDIRLKDRLLVSAGSDGEVKIWELDDQTTQLSRGKRVTKKFVSIAGLAEPFEFSGNLWTTDGRGYTKRR